MENEKVLYAALETIFAKVTKRALNVAELERLRSESKRIVQAIKSMSERQALEKCNKLNLATREAFRQVALDIKDLSERLDRIEPLVEPILTKFKQPKRARKKAAKR